MRITMISLLIGLGLAEAVAPASACPYGTSASNGQASTTQTADNQSTGQRGAN